MNTILEESVVRHIVPKLKQAGACGIVEYPPRIALGFWGHVSIWHMVQPIRFGRRCYDRTRLCILRFAHDAAVPAAQRLGIR